MITGTEFLLLIFIAILFINIKYSGRAIYENYMDQEYSVQLRGICALAIVFHHISQKLSTGIFVLIFQRVGCLAVAVFFLLSGYGLMKQLANNQKYLEQFLLKKLIRLGIPYAVYIVLFFIVRGCEYLFSADAFTSYSYLISWFVISIAFMYLAFWLSYRKGNHGNFKLILFIALYIAVCITLRLSGWWYNATLAFALGVYLSCYENNIKGIVIKHYWIILGFVLGLYEILMLLKRMIPSQMISMMTEIIAPSIFAIAVFILGYKLQFRNPIWTQIGKLSMESYLVNILIIQAVYERYFLFYNDLIYTLVCVLIIYVTAFIMSVVDYKLSKGLSRLLIKES